MKVLITGGAGFIGNHLCRKFATFGAEVICFDNLNSQIHIDKSPPVFDHESVRFIEGDVREFQDYLGDIGEFDYLFHLASETGTGQSMYEIGRYYDTNVMGTAAILDGLLEYKIKPKKIILSSSRSIYGEGAYKCRNCGHAVALLRTHYTVQNGNFDPTCCKCNIPMTAIATDESCTPSPNSFYAGTKLAQEQMLEVFCRTHAIDFSIFRFQNVYGPGQALDNPYTGILAIFSKLMKLGLQIEVFEDGYESRDFVFIDDVINIIGPDNLEKFSNKVINIGTGVQTTVLEVINSLANALEIDPRYVITSEFRSGDIRHNYACTKKLMEELPNIRFIEFQHGVKEFVESAFSDSSLANSDTSSYRKSLDELKQKGLLK
jgi:dTDP-L-rhamnose 4-epimerase